MKLAVGSLGFFKWRQYRFKVVFETLGVFSDELFNTLKFFGADDQTGVMALLRSINDLRIVVGRGVRVLLFCER